MVLNILLIIIAFAGMEAVAWFTHRYVMHGFMWFLHRDHHQKHKGFFEWNDLFVVMFAIPSWLNIMYGMMHGYDFKFYIGVGIALYGIAYFLVHEIIIHQRVKLPVKNTNPYVIAMRKAHKVHHSYTNKAPGDNFGFVFLIPWKYFSDAWKEASTSQSKIS